MNAGGRLAAFGGVLLIAFGGAYGIAAAVTSGAPSAPEQRDEGTHTSGGVHSLSGPGADPSAGRSVWVALPDGAPR